jgi:hypothetical protein
MREANAVSPVPLAPGGIAMFEKAILNRCNRACGVLSVLLFVLSGLALCADRAMASETLSYSASAYGTYAVVGQTVTSGKTAFVSLGCSTDPNAHGSNTVASVSFHSIISTGAINTSYQTTASSSEATADIANVSLLGGLITATEVKAVSQTTLSGGTFSVDATGSIFSSLTVAGIPVTVIAPNTTIPLLGLGRVVLFEQISSVRRSSARLTVNMIHVYVTESNLLGIAVGTEIIVSSASSHLSLMNVLGELSGLSYGTRVSVAGAINSGPSVPQPLACQGTDGNVDTNSIASVNIPNVLSTGEVVDTAQGTVSSVETSGDTSSTISSLNLLTGLVSADTLTVKANASTTNGTQVDVNDDGTSFVHLSVVGHPEITDNVPPNTRVSLAGIGTLILRYETTSSNSIKVNAIKLTIGKNNTVGLPAGAVIIIGSAQVAVHTNSLP